MAHIHTHSFFMINAVPAKESKWDKATNCRRFFDSYAQEHGFDPLRWENWMALPLKQLSHKKVGYIHPLLFHKVLNISSSSHRVDTHCWVYIRAGKEHCGLPILMRGKQRDKNE